MWQKQMGRVRCGTGRLQGCCQRVWQYAAPAIGQRSCMCWRVFCAACASFLPVKPPDMPTISSVGRYHRRSSVLKPASPTDH